MVSKRLIPSESSYNWSYIETTAHSLAATLGLLASNKGIQDEIFEHIIGVVGYDHAPVGVNDTNHPSWVLILFSGFRRLPKA